MAGESPPPSRLDAAAYSSEGPHAQEPENHCLRERETETEPEAPQRGRGAVSGARPGRPGGASAGRPRPAQGPPQVPQDRLAVSCPGCGRIFDTVLGLDSHRRHPAALPGCRWREWERRGAYRPGFLGRAAIVTGPRTIG